MKISTKGRYGVRILVDLALNDDQTAPRMIRDIAISQNLSEKYIGRLIIELRRAGLVRSIRGAGGGYRLAKDPAAITLLEIVEIMEGPLALVDCVGAKNVCQRKKICGVSDIWSELTDKMRENLRIVTLAEILRRCAGRQIPPCES